MEQVPLRRESTDEPISIDEMDVKRRSRLGGFFLGYGISLSDRGGQGSGYRLRISCDFGCCRESLGGFRHLQPLFRPSVLVTAPGNQPPAQLLSGSDQVRRGNIGILGDRR